MNISRKVVLGVLLFALGFTGILSMLTMEIPIPENIKQVIDKLFTPIQFKLLSLANPTFMLLFFVAIGVSIYDRVGFQLPIFEKIAFRDNRKIDYQGIIKFGVAGGIVCGILLVLVSNIFGEYIPQELNKFSPTVLNRLLYGGITEEILMRFGLMTLVVWLLSLVFKNKRDWIYLTGIVVSSLLFGVGHLPIVSILVPNPTMQLVVYIILGNSLGGLIFGWLYWKKGLETAILAHVFAHLVLITITALN